MNIKRLFKGPWLWIILIVIAVHRRPVLLGVVPTATKRSRPPRWCGYFDDAKVKDVTFVDGDQEIRATLKGDDKKVKATGSATRAPSSSSRPRSSVDDKEMKSYNVKMPPKTTLLSVLLELPAVRLSSSCIFLWLMNSMQGGGGRVMQFAKSKAKLMTKDTPQTTFADVAGC